jgi:hypothetical protein
MGTMSTQTRGIGLAALVLLLGTLAVPAEAQDAPSRWVAFVGCWEPLSADGDAGLLCFESSGNGVEMSNVFEGEVTATEALVADGVPRPVTAEGCTGTESVSFSEDGRRVFTESSFSCEGGESRAGTGVMSFISPTQWIDVRSLTVDGEPVAWVQRYSAATPESLQNHLAGDPPTIRPDIRARRLAAARDIDMADVEEALARVDAQAVKAWVATHDTPLDVDGSTLLRLADAGVPEDVIDVMVAVSHPDRFVVTPDGVPQGVRDRVAANAYRSGARLGYRSFLLDPYYYSPFGYRSRYGYSPFGYYGYGYGGYVGYVPASIVITPRDYVQRSGGRIVSGQGYRGRTSSGGRISTSRGGSSGGAASSSGSGGGGRSSSGSSGGSRSAVPR